MQRLYAPWRTTYVKQEEKIEGCVFCHISNHIDKVDDLQILFNCDECFVVMNKFPYSPGHIMVIPHFHTDKLEELDPLIWSKMTALAQKGVELLKNELNAHGVNLGMNLGAIAGAGIAEHIHLHLVPRWKGDTNFITTIGETRVYSVDFETIFEKLKSKSDFYFGQV